MMKLRQRLDPTSLVYLLAHALLVAFGVFAVRSDSRVWVGIGTSLVAAGITGWTVFVYIFLSRDLAARLEVLSQFGVVRVFGARSIRIREEYDMRLSAAREAIDILGFGLRALREDYIDAFPQWRQRAHVRILLLDPAFPNPSWSFAAQRDLEERQEAGVIAQDVRNFIRSVMPIIRMTGKYPFEVRLYRALPTMNIFRIDDEVFFGPYLLNQPSRNSPTFLLRRGGILFDRVTSHFETIWSDPALSVSVDSLET
jgi:hypothetical protein